MELFLKSPSDNVDVKTCFLEDWNIIMYLIICISYHFSTLMWCMWFKSLIVKAKDPLRFGFLCKDNQLIFFHYIPTIILTVKKLTWVVGTHILSTCVILALGTQVGHNWTLFVWTEYQAENLLARPKTTGLQKRKKVSIDYYHFLKCRLYWH